MGVIPWGALSQGSVIPGGVLSQGDVIPGGVLSQGGCYPREGVIHCHIRYTLVPGLIAAVVHFNFCNFYISYFVYIPEKKNRRSSDGREYLSIIGVS